MKPSALERAVATGKAPALALLMERGTYVDACCAAFPSVTPVCAAAIATGTLQDRHHIPSMNWYWREEKRYVEYGSSFGASRRFGLNRQIVDTVYRMNAEHLPADVPTVFESLDDAGVRTAGTTYLMYRGRHEHRISRETALTRLASTVVRRSVMGPKELFYADIFASRETGCRSQLGLPGIRDQHAGCVATYLIENDLFHFLPPSGAGRDDAEIALCPAQRSAMVYALLPEGRDALVPRLVDAAAALEGRDLVMWRPAPREGAIRSAAGELRFAPGGDVRDERGGRWSVDGPLEVLDAKLRDGELRTTAY